ncbi:MAG TPA: heme-binding protein [Candidatus Acidoferrum sp.]|jgi:uncharacterized protein GlcG (DUF336 family)|nr:heme-binding protein [Candidatus Acidoferrum sp.]
MLAALVLIAPHSAHAQACGTTTTVACLTAADVMNAVQGAATAISPDTMVIAVVDRAGTPLAVFRKAGAPATVVGNFGFPGVDTQDYAVGLARTGAFFSNDQAPLSSRTVRFISGIHFPPGVTNKPPAALYGIENTNRGCALNPVLDAIVPRATSLAGGACTGGGATAGCGTGIVTGKADLFDSNPAAVDPGGVPIFKDGRVAGGIGVAGVSRDAAEFAALFGSVAGGPRFGPRLTFPDAVILDGIRLPFVNNTVRPAGVGPGVFAGAFVVGPIPSPREAGVPSGYLVGPNAGPTLSAASVNTIVQSARAQADRTRAAIRLPLGSPTRMVIAVSDLAGTILAVFRMPDATVFSIDVAATKARNVVYFSSATRNPGDMPGFPLGFSMTARTIGFGAMPLFPPGIDGTSPGPFFGDFRRDVLNVCTQARDPNNLGNQSGIVFFPGSIGIYSGGTLVGGLGVSGDGVEQDDLVTAAGVTPNFVAPPSIRADRVLIGGVRLPFFKFPRNPEIR